jgi:hypothetical protein
MFSVPLIRVCMLLSAIEIEESEGRTKKKSYFIKNGIDPLPPSCHPLARDLYKSTKQSLTVVLRGRTRLL